jgi:hypothetical protein
MIEKRVIIVVGGLDINSSCQRADFYNDFKIGNLHGFSPLFWRLGYVCQPNRELTGFL